MPNEAPDTSPAANKAAPAHAVASAVNRPKVVRYRPMSHKVIGSCELVVALALIVFAYAGGFGYRPLPIGPIWYQLVGWTLAYYSTVWFRLVDRPK